METYSFCMSLLLAPPRGEASATARVSLCLERYRWKTVLKYWWKTMFFQGISYLNIRNLRVLEKCGYTHWNPLDRKVYNFNTCRILSVVIATCVWI
ncbi:hypothetical protein FKM82_003288 [Ascaphus truei]